MLGLTWKVLSGGRRGDWRSRLILIAQIAVGLIAALAGLATLTSSPLLLLAFSFGQPLAIVGIVLFVIVAIFAQRTMVLEEFKPGEVIFREGDIGREVYVIKSGAIEVLMRQPDGSEQVIKRLGSGDHFGEMALLRRAPRNATVRATTAAEVFKVSAGNFMALYTSLPGFRDQFNKTMAVRLEELEPPK